MPLTSKPRVVKTSGSNAEHQNRLKRRQSRFADEANLNELVLLRSIGILMINGSLFVRSGFVSQNVSSDFCKGLPSKVGQLNIRTALLHQ
jgi:hypothetical protein